jgi:hypothetical protein
MKHHFQFFELTISNQKSVVGIRDGGFGIWNLEKKSESTERGSTNSYFPISND